MHSWSARLALWSLVATTLLTTAQFSGAQDKPVPKFSLIEWNIEAGGSDIATIVDQIKQLAPFDLLAVSEVPVAATEQFTHYWHADSFILATAGGNARLVMAWNPQVFEKVKTEEMKKFQGQELAPGIQPAPLVAQLRHLKTGQELIVIQNHLARGSAELRKKQALLLVQWAKQQTLPVVAIGGYNFDYDFTKHKGNEAFDAFLADDTWKWIKPGAWVDSNWADRNRDGKDDYPDSMLDYVFAAGPAKTWPMTSEIIVRPGDFPDTDKTSDHRPVRCTVGK